MVCASCKCLHDFWSNDYLNVRNLSHKDHKAVPQFPNPSIHRKARNRTTTPQLHPSLTPSLKMLHGFASKSPTQRTGRHFRHRTALSTRGHLSIFSKTHIRRWFDCSNVPSLTTRLFCSSIRRERLVHRSISRDVMNAVLLGCGDRIIR